MYTPEHMINAEVIKTGNENALSLLRKFNRRMQSTGLVRHMHANRYHQRSPSKAVKKKGALKRLERRNQRLQLIKEGKISEAPVRGPGAAKRAA